MVRNAAPNRIGGRGAFDCRQQRQSIKRPPPTHTPH